MDTSQTKTVRTMSQIAAEIQRDWGAKVNFAAKPYLQAMHQLDSINDDYGYDSGRSVVIYFLSNANTWRGEAARRIKKELNGLLASASASASSK